MNTVNRLFRRLHIPFNRHYLYDIIRFKPINSLSDFSSLLDTYRIPNLAVQLQSEQLLSVSFPCVAHCHRSTGEAYFVVVEGIERGQVAYSEGEKLQRVTVEVFAKLWSGAVLLLAPDAQSGEPNYAQNRKAQWVQTGQQAVAYGGLGLCAIGLLGRATGWPEAIWLLLQFLGLAICVLLLVNEYGKPGPFIGKLCRAGKQTNCQAVLQSSGAKLFGWLSLAEVGFMFFLGGVLWFGVSTSLPEKALVVGAVLPFSFWSVYYQWRVAKTWCVLCLSVLAVLWLSFWVCFPLDGFGSITLVQVVNVVLAYGLGAGLWFLVRPYVLATQQKASTQQELNHWRHNSNLFKASLIAQPLTPLSALPNEDQIGNLDAPVILTMVSNPHCNPCRDAHAELTAWQRYFCDEVQLRIRHINSGDERYTLHDEWAEQVAIEYTPTLFINGRKLTEPYNYSDIRYHIRALAEA